MEIYERIKELRKDYLHLSQEAFGKELGVSRSVINNIERNVLQRPEQKEPIYRLICSKFNINYEWLTNGTEPMIMSQDNDIDKYIKDLITEDNPLYNTVKSIVNTYNKLDNKSQATLLNFSKQLLEELKNK